ncbi:uncharacterized protein L3040_001183 [Drepanopeziza brunnea f. sp. 'multigermtubi']|uniref:Small secreted protein n=1 Tax=Marssonina brunnea f. sp. multigermtubi (strain MB_m1) TaxID=1072389 RepID=K1WH35_MARBU|nr:uncharacterized protein MBM_05369 [Drepanopeziza brunnea f. sp. 'multigermtubi' MB_m1]EKD16900.1 hypothetical protein MBM_05369 [Drepanopeziza brunnea f. sp. 'multigermtubi' MB_m1]KAJ5054921.1 hypothetical protein L3040_001183 [Drepanopeziza brunnea f. sp. 'multigermtubi']
MKFTNAIVATALLASSSVVAGPTPPIAARQIKQEISLCLQKDFVDCHDLAFNDSECMNFYAGVSIFNDAISSYDTKGFECHFWYDLNCGESATFMANGRSASIYDDGSNYLFDDKISSMMCRNVQFK